MCALHGDQGDSPSETRCGVGSCLPASMVLRELLEAYDLSLRGPSPIRGVGLIGCSACGSSDVLECPVRLFEFVGIEAGAGGGDSLLPGVELSERGVVEVVKVAGEVLVGEVLGVVPRGLGRAAEPQATTAGLRRPGLGPGIVAKTLPGPAACGCGRGDPSTA
jgi:hypothetical protein